jgi:hypothetical protein
LASSLHLELTSPFSPWYGQFSCDLLLSPPPNPWNLTIKVPKGPRAMLRT